MVGYRAIDWHSAFARRTERMKASEIRELLKLLARPEIISFAGGIPDPALFPTKALRSAYDAVLSDPHHAGQALQYSVSEGYEPLRSWISSYMARRGVRCGVENIVITAGSQQGLDLLGKLLLSPGDTALVTAPTYLGALQAFNAYEPRYASFQHRALRRQQIMRASGLHSPTSCPILRIRLARRWRRMLGGTCSICRPLTTRR
jgi:DNA-binding transcriptional MocR family regulator